jgi:hypothetical protein
MSRNATGSAAPAFDDVRGRAPLVLTLKGRSSKEFHASHWGQRPSHRVASNPHAEQK